MVEKDEYFLHKLAAVALTILLVGGAVGAVGGHWLWKDMPKVTSVVRGPQPIGSDGGYVIDATRSNFEPSVRGLLPDGANSFVIVLTFMTRQGEMRLVAGAGPAGPGGPTMPPSDGSQMRLFEIFIPDPTFPVPQLVGEVTGQVWYFNSNNQCWMQLMYSGQPVPSENCIGR